MQNPLRIPCSSPMPALPSILILVFIWRIPTADSACRAYLNGSGNACQLNCYDGYGTSSHLAASAAQRSSRICLIRFLERRCGVKKSANQAAKKVASHPPRLTIKVRLSRSELKLAARAARQQKRTIEEIVEDFLLNGTSRRPNAFEGSAEPGRGAGPGAEDWRAGRGQANGHT